MEGKIAVLGNTDFVMPFSTIGLETFAVGSADEEILANAEKIVEGNYALVIVAENVAQTAEKVFSAQRNKPLPCITVVPFTTEPTGIATEFLGDALRRATGINILKSN